ncbi:MAG: DUF5683 domain-containing protein [Bacteroidales bacterium]|nr:DUF5683 domain-containing protein [Bacteroidales bacterium]
MIKKIVLVIWVVVISFRLFAQDNTLNSEHSPTKAAVLSAIIPGGGQFYNKKYWKIPLVYGGLTIFGLFTYNYNSKYVKFKNSYKELYTTNPNGFIIVENNQYTLEGLNIMQNYYHRRRDLYGLMFLGWYFLNIIDATVDAYLFDYDVSENLSFRAIPYYDSNFLVCFFKINLKI